MTGPEKTLFNYWNVQKKKKSIQWQAHVQNNSVSDGLRKIACKEFSGEMYKLKWLEISRNVRKLHTLTELVLEAKENVHNPSKSRKHKKHPDLPKNPLTAYLHFF